MQDFAPEQTNVKNRIFPSEVTLTQQVFGRKLHWNIDAHQVKELANKLPKEHKTVVSYFKASLQQMLEKMRTAQPLFVRCIKPNERQKPGDFDSKKVKEQLLYNGIAEIARIRKFGFSTRRTYMEFRGRYGDLCPESKTEKDRTEAARTILKEIFPFTDIKDQNIRFGKNRIFFRDFIFTTLEEKLEELKQKKRNDAAVIIQKNWRGELGRRKARDRKRAEAKRILEKELSGMSFGPVTKKNPIFDPDDDSLNDSPPSMDSPIQESVESSDDDLGRLPSKFSNLKDTLHKSHPSILKKPHVPGSSGDVNRTNGDITSTISSGASGSSTSSAYKTFDNVSGSNSDKTKMSNDSHAKKKVEDIEAKLKEETEEEDRAAFWDIFQIIEREGGSEDVHSQRVMIFLKIFFYILLGLVLLFCCVTQKISLMVLVSSFGLSNMKEEKGTYFLQARYLLTLLAVCIPYAVSFLSNLYKVCFGDFPTPRWSTFIVCFLVETAHTAGLSILTFKILPQLDFLTGIMVLSATASIPSVLKLLCASNSSEKSNCSKKFMWYVCDLIAMCVQLTIIPVMILSDVIWTSTVSFSESRALDILFVILAFLLVSVVHWENFTDNRLFVKLKYRGSLCQSLFQLKYDLQEGRPLVSVVTTMWKIGVTILLAYLLRPSLKDNFDVIKAFDELDNEHEISLYTSVLCLTITPFVAHYVAATACKLRMQKFSFSLPLLLSTPVSVGAALIQCNTYGFINTISTEFSDKLCGNTSDIFFPWWKFLFGACWWLSLHVCVRHIWLPRQERLAKLKRLFISPQYCSILLEEYFVLNRRRDDRIIQREQDDKKFIYHLIKPTSKDPKQSAQTDRGNAAKESDRIVPMVYACGTMWHETRKEMVQLLKSLFRMDKEQFFRRVYEEVTGKQDPDYFDFESHIFFDDCMELNDDEELVPNSFVRQFITCVNVAASSVHKRVMDIGDPVRIITPYGGQLVWEMPGGCLMYVHLKDKVKIKHRKRWSQVMYMYYLLGYRLNRECQDKIEEEIESGAISRHLFEQGEALDMLDRNVKAKADNTFLLALDGDVDFTPGAVRLLIDRMKKNDKVGAACGRIHPIGSGPMVWYQKFEYAVGHWLQKATEHVVGCVLCSPGCFSLFRGSSLMDNNVMKKYTLMPSEAVHYLQYDQGEDRWLCTLLIQQGYKVDYCAASDAWTFAPESFGEFFNQRRRWMPSTLANILDLLSASSDTVAVNSNMSYLYIAYQAMLFYSTLIGPGTIIMMIAGAFATVFELSLLDSYLIAVIPAAFYFALCLKAPSAVQINVAAILSAIYAFIMMIVFVGSIIMALQQSFFHPSVIFMVVLALIFILSAIFHPKEWTCVIPGIMYFLCIPSGYLLLVLYSMCNMYVVSWGTREVPRKKTKRELAEEKRKAEEKKKEKKPGFFSRFFFSNQLEQLKESLQKTNLPGTNKHESEMISLLKEMNANIKALLTKEGGQPVNLSEKLDVKPKKKVGFKETVTPPESEDDEEEEMIVKKVRDEMENPAWSEDPCLGKNTTLIVDLDECSFWEQVIAKYLKPMEKNVVEEKKTTAQLIELRNNACFGMALVNLMWIAINFMFQYKKPTEFSVEYELGEETYEMKIEILGLLFIIFFIAILIIQFYGMLVHRWGTLLHLISITEVRSSGTINAEMQQSSEKEKLLRLCQDVYHVPVPDYDIDGDDADNNVTGADNMTYPPSLPPRPERLPSFSMTLAQSIKQNSQFGHRKSMKRRGSSGAAVSTAEQLKESRKLGDDRYFKDLLRRNLSGEMDSQFAPPDADQMIKRRYTRNENLSRNAAWFGTITKRAMKRVQMSAFEMGGENRNGSLAKSRRRYEEENIYDDIPASRMGRHFAKNVSKLKKSIHGRYAPNDRSAYYEQGGRPQGNMMLYP